MSIINFLEKLQIFVERAMMVVAGIVVMLMMMFITIDVVCRKLSISFPGIYETVQILTVAVVFLGIAYVQKVKGHIFIEVATTKLPLKVQRGLDFLGYVIGVFICGVITWQSVVVAWESIAILEYAAGVIRIPVWPAKLIVAVGFLFMTTRLLFDMLFFFVPAMQQEKITAKEGDSAWH